MSTPYLEFSWPKGVDYAPENIHNLREAIPKLKGFEVKSKLGYSTKVAMKTCVTQLRFISYGVTPLTLPCNT